MVRRKQLGAPRFLGREFHRTAISVTWCPGNGKPTIHGRSAIGRNLVSARNTSELRRTGRKISERYGFQPLRKRTHGSVGSIRKEISANNDPVDFISDQRCVETL